MVKNDGQTNQHKKDTFCTIVQKRKLPGGWLGEAPEPERQETREPHEDDGRPDQDPDKDDDGEARTTTPDEAAAAPESKEEANVGSSSLVDPFRRASASPSDEVAGGGWSLLDLLGGGGSSDAACAVPGMVHLVLHCIHQFVISRLLF